MTARVGLLCLLVATSISGAHAETQPSTPDLSFTVHLHGNYAKAAICIAPTPTLSPARRMTGLASESTGSWSRDGRAFAYADGDPPSDGIRVVDVSGDGGRVVTRPRPNELDSAPAWSPDDTEIAFARYVFFARRVDYARAGVWVTVLASGRERQLSRRLAGTLDWSPSGDVIAADLGGELNTQIDFLRPSGGVERTIRVGRDAAYEDGVSWSPDGARLAVGGGLIVDRNGHEAGKYAPVTGSGAVVRSPAWSPEGDSVAYERALSWTAARTNVRVLGNGDLYLGSAAGGAPVRLTATTRIDEAAPAWRPSSSDAAGLPQPCVLSGTSRRDVLSGTQLDDLVDAGAGDDVVYGAGGNDFLAGGAGNDVLVGGPGRDALWGENGHDRFRARDGSRDSNVGGRGDDRAWVDRRLDDVVGVERVFLARGRH